MARPYDKSEAIKLRKLGYSYNVISEKLGVRKSTLSGWLRTVPYVPNQEIIERIGKARAASGLAKHKIRLQSFDEAEIQARSDIKSLSKRDIFMLGLGLYVGEGTKTYDIVRIANANPKVIKFAIKWFRTVCNLKMRNFRIRIHLYPDTDVKKAINFWSKATSIPKNQFQETQVDFRKDKKMFKRGRLPFGTAHLSIRSHGRKEFGVFLARRINAWIEKVLK